MLGIYCIYTFNKFNFHSIKLVTLKLHNYNSWEKTIIGKMEKHFIKCLNATALDTANTPIKICSIYALHITGFNLNQLTTFENVVVICTKKWKLMKSLSKAQRNKY